MRVHIFGVLAPQIDEVHRLGAGHPVFGELVDMGTYATIAGAAPEPASFVAQLGACVAAEPDAQRLGLALTELTPLADAPRLVDRWRDRLAAEDAVSVIVLDGRTPPLFVLCGYAIPCMGPVQRCSLEDVVATWVQIGGGSTARGRSLIEEPDSLVDPAAEEILTERLRQLYGD